MREWKWRVVLMLGAMFWFCRQGQAELIWIEGEKPATADVARHPWWYDKVNRHELSGGDFISNWSADKAGVLTYRFETKHGGDFDFWVRANPVAVTLLYSLNGAASVKIDSDHPIDVRNIAEGGAIDLRFIAWIHVGRVKLKQGENSVEFRMESKNNHHGMLDCFVFTTEAFQPRGTDKPGAKAPSPVADEADWFAFNPGPDAFAASPIDLRFLNEKQAGDGGFIGVKNGQFVHSQTGEAVRFWAVNGPPGDANDPAQLSQIARLLAKHGINLVRVHGALYDQDGQLDPARVQRYLNIVAAMKPQGIYCHFSIYFPLWLNPKPNSPFLKGYDGSKNPFAALYFNPEFQAKYHEWCKALLTTTPAGGGKAMIDDPGVAGVEMVNEDSYFFWTFNASNIPDPQLRLIESQFGEWLKAKYGSLDEALAAWGPQREPRDNAAEGRVGFRPLWQMFNERTQRDQDTASFLVDSQRKFYADTYKYIRGLGFKGVITASNWTTASQPIFGPLEKYSYTVADFIDRHGYFSCDEQGEASGWSVREGHTYADRDALKFDPEEPGKPKSFSNTIMDIKYDDKPSMVSEITFTRPNRYRTEAPLFYAAYGSLQGSNSIVHFVVDGDRWSPKPGYFVQPWTLMSPDMMGQFPAAALIFRRGLVDLGDELVNVNLKIADIMALKGTPLAQDAAIDELRLKDVPNGQNLNSDTVIDPLVNLAGRTSIHFTAEGGPSKVGPLSKYIDRKARTISSTNGQVHLDYGKGLLTLNAPAAQGVVGDLAAAGETSLRDLKLSSKLDLAGIVAVSLDDRPLSTSKLILLQVMSEEKPSGFVTEDAGAGMKRIVSLGQDPWMVRKLEGRISFTRPDAAQLKVTPLDLNGYPVKAAGKLTATDIKLDPQTVYYLVGG